MQRPSTAHPQADPAQRHPTRRFFLRLGFCTLAGGTIAVIEKLRFARQVARMTPSRPRDPIHDKLLAMLALDDEGFAKVGMVFASECHAYRSDSRMRAGCERLIRLGLSRGGANGDATVEAGVVGLGALGALDVLRALRDEIDRHADLPRAHAALTGWLGRRR